MLDTNIISELIKHPQGLIFYKIQKIGEAKICTSIVVAAHALSLNLTLVTANIREFSRVSNLKVENWLSQD